MRALTVEELEFVSGGFGFGDDPPDPPVVVTAPKPKKKSRSWENWQICEGDCIGNMLKKFRLDEAIEKFGQTINEFFDTITPDYEDNKNQIKLECKNGTVPTYVGHLNGQNGPIPIYQCR